jgi:hypothetical protein
VVLKRARLLWAGRGGGAARLAGLGLTPGLLTPLRARSPYLLASVGRFRNEPEIAP